MTQAFNTIRQNIGNITLAEHIELLGWYLDRGQSAPLTLPDAVDEELYPAAQQFQRMYSSIMAAVDSKSEVDSDYVRELRRIGAHFRADIVEARI